jgi:hypothetical protein
LFIRVLPAQHGADAGCPKQEYLISNYHVVKSAAKVRLLTGAGLLDDMVVAADRKFEAVVKLAQDAAVLVLVY